MVTPLLSFVLADAQRLVVIACNLSDLMWEMNVTTVGYHVSLPRSFVWGLYWVVVSNIFYFHPYLGK